MNKVWSALYDDEFLQRWWWLLLLVVALFSLAGGLDSLPLIDRDEPRFVRATVEMMQTQQWLIPYFNDEYRFDKPPLTYWWMRLHFNLFGISEWSARLHSLIASYFCALAIFAFGRSLFGIKPAMLAALAWLTCLQVIIHARMAVADMPMVLAVILVMWAAWELLTQQPHQRFGRWYWLFWLSMSFGFLGKGPITFFVPILAWVLFRYGFYRQPLAFGRLQYVTGSLLFLILVGLWGIPALIETQGAFWDVGIGKHVVERGTSTFNNRMAFPGYYLISSFMSLMPWAAFIWRAVALCRRNRDMQGAYLLAWLLSSLLIFSFYATQLPHYTLPSVAAFFLLLFRPDASGYQAGRRERYFFYGVFGAYATAALILAFITLLQEAPDHTPTISTILSGLVVLIIALLAIVGAYRWRQPTIAALGLVAILFGTSTMSAAMRAASPIIAIRDTIKIKPEKGQWTGVGFKEPGLVFYGEQPWTFHSNYAVLTANSDSHVIQLQEYSVEDYFKSLLLGGPIEMRKDFRQQIKNSGIDAERYQQQWGINFARVSLVKLLVIPPAER